MRAVGLLLLILNKIYRRTENVSSVNVIIMGYTRQRQVNGEGMRGGSEMCIRDRCILQESYCLRTRYRPTTQPLFFD